LLKHLSGAKLAKEDQNKKKDPWACIDGATQGKNQHGYWYLHESKKPWQPMHANTMPLATIDIGDACEYLFLGCWNEL
jgi:hypothetical protein